MKRHLLVSFFVLAAFAGQLRAQDLNHESVLNQQSDTNFSVPFAQPAMINFHIPIKVDHSYLFHPQRGQEESGDYGVSDTAMDQTLTMPQKDTVIQSYEVNNLITLRNYTHDNGSNPTRLVKFSIDTVQRTLKNVYVYYFWDPFSNIVYEIDSFTISSIPYNITWNHHLFASDQGIGLFSKLSGVFFYRAFLSGDGYGGAQHDYYSFRGLSTDTTSCRFTLDLKTTDPAFGVSMQKDMNEDFLEARPDALSGLLTFFYIG